MTKQISVNEIRIDGNTQMRLEIDYVTVDDYASAFTAGKKLPPLVVFFDGVSYWLADGFHRWHAARKAELQTVACDVRQGSQRDAILFAVGANDENGLRRKPCDKRVAVMTLLHDPEWAKRADSWIADAAKVSRPFVADQRKQAGNCNVAGCEDGQVERRVGRDGKSRRVKKKPKKKKPNLHVAPIDEEVEPPKLEVTPRPPLRKSKSFDAERNLVRALADLVTLVKKTHYESTFDKGRFTHELNTWANEIAEAVEEAEAVA